MRTQRPRHDRDPASPADRAGPGGGGSGGGGGGGGRQRQRPPRLPGESAIATAPPKMEQPNTAALSAEVSAEVQAALAEMNAAMAGANPAPAPARPPISGTVPAIRGPRVVQSGREHRSGTVVSVGPSDIFIEFGPKELGVVPRSQWKEGEEPPAVAGQLEVVIDKYDTTENLFHCSRPGAIQKADWENLQVGQLVEARVTGVNKGGLELEVASHRAFMPAGQVSLDRIPDLSVLVGEKLPCVVTQVDTRGRGNIVLSRREILQKERAEKAAKLKDSLVEGATIDGFVRKIMPFGAFVDLGGIDGLLHLSDLTHDRVNPGEKNVEKYVKEGDKVSVRILKLDWEAKRISLGLKQLQADPFQSASEGISEGADVTGRVTKLLDFGAFVEIAPGVEGLVHVSEIARRRIDKPADVLQSNQVIQVRVLKIDRDSRKISLSMRALEPMPQRQERPKTERDIEREQKTAARLAEIQKETPALRRAREQSKGRQLKGGFGASGGLDDGGGLAGLKLGR